MIPELETEPLFDDHMGATRVGFQLTYSSLYHLARGGAVRLVIRPSITIPRTILWLDVSKWQGEIDFVVMAEAAPHGLIMKCGQGSARDSQFERNRVESKRNGIPRGTYWFYDSRIPPKQQALLWWTWVQVDTWELMHFADYEENYGGAFGGWQNFKIFLQEFQRLSGLPASKIGIYTAYYYWIAHSPTSTTELNYFLQFTLWEAWYTTNPSHVLIPRPWGQATLIAWQYGTNGPDGKTPRGRFFGMQSEEVDENNVNTQNEETYRKLFGLDPLPPPGGIMKFGIATGNITVRVGPAVSFMQYKINGVGVFVMTGDRIESPEQRDGFWKLSKLTRVADNTVITFPTDAWCGAAFIDEVTPPPPAGLPDVPITIVAGDDVAYIKQTVSIILKPKV